MSPVTHDFLLPDNNNMLPDNNALPNRHNRRGAIWERLNLEHLDDQNQN